MEAALFGDTEIAVSDLKSHIERLKAVPEGKAISRLQEEFEVSFSQFIVNSP